MKWSDHSGSVEHLDCELHDVPSFKETLRIRGITPGTFHRSGLIRQGLLTREEAMKQEERDLLRKAPPAELVNFLADNQIEYSLYEKAVTGTDKSRFEPKLEKLVRELYHRFRKF